MAHMSLVIVVLLVAAALCLLLAAVGVASRVNLLPLGLLFWLAWEVCRLYA